MRVIILFGLLAGACATGTHGSGDENANLAAAVSALEFVAADGSVVALSRDRDGDAFRGAVVSLGALGAVTCLTLDVRPAFDVASAVMGAAAVDDGLAEVGVRESDRRPAPVHLHERVLHDVGGRLR